MLETLIEPVAFRVRGTRVVGHLHRPRLAQGRLIGLVVGGPMTSVKEQVTGVYAAALAAAKAMTRLEATLG